MNLSNPAVLNGLDMCDRTKILPVAAVCAGQTIWGFSYIFTKVAMGYAKPDVLLSIRFILAFLIMNIMCLTGKFKVSIKGKRLKPLIMLGIMEPLYFYFESYGILYTNAMFSGVIIALVPVVSILLAVMLLKEYPTKRQAVFCLLPIAGVIVITISSSAMGIVRPLGVFLLILTCLTSAGYKIVNRKSAVEFTAFERTYIVLLVSSVVFTVSAFVSLKGDIKEYIEPIFHLEFVMAVLALVVFCSVMANVFVNYAAGRMSVAKLATFGTLTTVWSIFAGVLFLGEPITVVSFIGSILILIGIWQVTKAQD